MATRAELFTSAANEQLIASIKLLMPATDYTTKHTNTPHRAQRYDITPKSEHSVFRRIIISMSDNTPHLGNKVDMNYVLNESHQSIHEIVMCTETMFQTQVKTSINDDGVKHFRFLAFRDNVCLFKFCKSLMLNVINIEQTIKELGEPSNDYPCSRTPCRCAPRTRPFAAPTPTRAITTDLMPVDFVLSLTDFPPPRSKPLPQHR